MRVWLIKIGEPLPIDGTNERLFRTGILANMLVKRGNKVIWWTSTFDHARKKQRVNMDTSIDINDCFNIRLLHSVRYKKNMSINRIINHYLIAYKFSKFARLEARPDIILCSFPTIELSLVATKYGKEKNVPVVIDVRDLWPDVLVNLFPKKIRWFIKAALFIFFRNKRKVFRECLSIVAISDGYLQWALSYADRKRSMHDAVFPLCYKKPIVADSQLKNAKFTLKKVGVDPSKIICLFIGMFGKTCNLSTVIDAAHQLDLQGINHVQFILSGDGENYSKWFKQAQGLNNVVFTGWIDLSKIAYLMSITDIGLAAYAEGALQGIPNKISEYLCAGVPILSSLKGALGDLLNTYNCGLTYESENADDLASKLIYLFNHPKILKEMSKNAFELYREKFVAEKVYNDMIEYLELVVKNYHKD